MFLDPGTIQKLARALETGVEELLVGRPPEAEGVAECLKDATPGGAPGCRAPRKAGRSPQIMEAAVLVGFVGMLPATCFCVEVTCPPFLVQVRRQP